jgi:hypothetical protein
LTLTDLAPGKKGELRLFFLEANGIPSGFMSVTPFRYPFTVEKDGIPDVTGMQESLK